MIWTLARRELRSLFASPLAWVILAVVQVLLAWFFLGYLDLYLNLQARLASTPNAPGVTEVVAAALYGTAGLVLLLVVPLLTMRLIADERRNQTLALLFSAPLTMTEIVLGKFLGILIFLVIMLALITLMPLSLMVGTDLDLGLIAGGLLGLFLALAAFAALGLFISSLTAQPTIAAVGSFGVLLLLWVIDFASTSGGQGETSALSYLSLLRHYQNMLKGLFDSSDVVYYVLFTLTFLVLSIRRLDAERLQR